MKKIFALLAVATLVVIFASGCGDTRASAPTSLTISPAAAHLDAGSSEIFTVTAANDPSFNGVTWTLTGGGSLSNSTNTVVRFTAGTSAGTSQLTATSTANPAETTTVTITTDADPRVTPTTEPTGIIGDPYKSTVTETGGVAPFTYAVTSGTLPAGLSISSSTGAISGTPTTAGVFSFTVTITDSNVTPQTFSWPITITVTAPLAINAAVLPTANVGVAYSFTPSATGGLTPYNWTISAGSLPAGLSINPATGRISGIPAADGNAAFTIQVSDSSFPAQTATLSSSLTIGGQSGALSIPAQQIPDATVGVPYVGTLQATGGAVPYTWTITGGSLPAGLSLNSSTGVISGSATAAGTANFTVKLTDSSSPVQTATASLSMRTDSAFSISISALPVAIKLVPYSATLTATGAVGPTTWAVTNGTLPAGLSLNATTGVISGTPSTVGTANFTLQVTDSATPPRTATLATSLVVELQLSLGTSVLPEGTIGIAYNSTPSVTGGTAPLTWSVISGSLPPGLSLNASSGAIAGTPSTAGSYTFMLQIKDSSVPAQTATAQVNIVILAPLSFTIPSLPNAVANVLYSTTLNATGAVAPLTWSISAGSLPAGLNLNASTGFISGTPTTTGLVTFTVKVTDSAVPPRSATAQTTILVVGALNITGGNLPNAVSGAPYSTTPVVSGGTTPLTWSISSGTLPPGLTLNPTSGLIAGTPTQAGTFTFTLHVTDSSTPPQSANISASITVNAALALTVPTLPDAIAGVPYVGTLIATGGTLPYSWSVTTGTLPAGLTLNATTGVISGTTNATGTSNFTGTLTDSSVPPQSKSFNLSIRVDAPLTIGPITLPIGVVGLPFNATITASGGVGPLTYSIAAGALPNGISLNAATGVISGTPLAVATGAVTIQVKDSSNPPQVKTTASLAVVVNAALALTVPTVPDAISGIPYVAPLLATGGTLPYSWSVTSGALPAGLTLNATTGVISGTTTATGTSNFTVTLTDSAVPPQTKAFNLSIRVDAPLTIGPITLPIGVVGLPFSATISASGGVGPLTYSVSAGALPTGITLNAGTGVISGTPLAVSVGAVTIQVKDSSNPPQVKTTASLPLNVNAALVINTTTLPGAISGILYNTTLSASGGAGPITWSVSAGSLPSGFSLNASTGVISGTSTALGLASFTLQAQDSATPPQVKTLAVTILVTPVLAITTTSLPNPILNVLFSTTLTATGGTGPITWSISAGSLPSGLSLNASTGVISGTPGLAGLVNFSVTAKDSSNPPQTKTVALSLQINTALTIPVTSLANAVLGNLYNTTLTATGGVAPITWSVTAGSLPLGLSLNTNGVISGTPNALGLASFTVTAKDSSNPPQTKSVSLGILTNPLLSIVNSTLPDGIVGALYNTTLTTTGGVAPIKWAVTGGTLPNGLSLNATTGVVTGIPTAVVSGSVIFQATDSSNPPQVQTVSINVPVFAKLAINPVTLAPGLLGTLIDTTLSATGGDGPYTWSISAGALPTGVTLDPSTGVLSGIPSLLGLFNFTVEVTDSAVPAQTATLAFSLNVASPGVNNSLLSGDYAFMFQGSNAAGPVVIVGSLHTDGTGDITSGVLDVNQASGATQNVAINSGNLSINADNRGTLTIDTSALGTQNFRIAVDAAGVLTRVIEADAEGTGTIRGNGVIKKQDPSAFVTTNINSALAFELEGTTLAGARSAVIGSLVTNGNGIITSGLLDANSAGTVSSNVAVANTSTYSVTGSTTGRGTMSLNAGTVGTVNGVIYVVNANDVFFMRTDALASHVDMLSGEILGQSGGPYGILGVGTGVLHVQGNSTTAGSSSVGAGLVVSTGLSILTGTYDGNDSGTINSTLVATGSNSISSAAAGRAALTFAGANYTMYYIAPGEAFVMDAAGSEVKTGMLEPQVGFPLNLLNLQAITYVNGSQGVANSGVTVQSGVAVITPLTALTGTVAATLDTNAPGDVINVGSLLNLNLTLATNGRISAGNTIYYLVSTSRIVAVEVGSGQTEARILVEDK